MSTTIQPTESRQEDTKRPAAAPDISLIDDGHEYAAQGSNWLRNVILGLLALAVLVGGVWGGYALLTSGGETASTVETHNVSLEDMLVTVMESGTVESANNTDIKCEVAGGTTILWIIKDGTVIEEPGEVLVRLDSSTIQEEVTQQEIVVERARSTEIQAEKSVEVAKINVREYEEGTFLQEKQTLESAIVVAEENLRSAKNALEHTQRMFRKGYATQLELEAQKFAVRRGELDLDAAETAKMVLVDFTKEKMLEDLNSQVATAEATLSSERKALELEETKLERLKTQLSKCVITAPKRGMVVYANENDRRGNDGVQIAEGTAVREQQTILRLPDLSVMQVKVSVHESRVDQIGKGDPASIEVLDRRLTGYVEYIANQPAQDGGWRGGNVKKYDTIVTIDPDSIGEFDLKPGMTAKVEILVEDKKQVIAVPNSAIFEDFVWLRKKSGEFVQHDVKSGVSNERFVEIISGLNADDVIARIPKHDFKDDIDAIRAEKPQMNTAAMYGEPRPGMGEGRGSGARGGAGRGGGGQGQGGQGQGRGFNLPTFSDTDTNGDGSITKDEVSGPLATGFDRVDSNGDGKIDSTEWQTMMDQFGNSQQQ